MKIIATAAALADIKAMAENRFGNLVKAVVDIERGIMAVDGELRKAIALGASKIRRFETGSSGSQKG